MGELLGIVRDLLEEELKIAKERDQDGFGKKNCGRVKGKERVAVCKYFAGW